MKNIILVPFDSNIVYEYAILRVRIKKVAPPIQTHQSSPHPSFPPK